MASSFISRGAAGYDSYMGRWSQRLAPLFLDFAGVGVNEIVADLGCGTGSLTFEVARRSEVARIEAIDYEADFIGALLERNQDARMHARQGDVCALPFKDAEFDRAYSMLVLHFVADSQRAIDEMRRVVRLGGVAAATVWDTFGGMPALRIFWDTAAAVEATAITRRASSIVRPMASSGELRSGFLRAGFVDVSDGMLTIRMDFDFFEDYWHPLLTGQGTVRDFLAGLPDLTRAQIENGVREAYLGGRPDGPRSFASVAWAVRGTVP